VHHVSYSSGPRLPAREGSRVPCVLRLRILPPCREGSGVATACPVDFCGPRVLSIKKILAGLSVQLGPYVPNARAHIPKVPDVKTIMDL
jgi:hypothetical protein